MLQGCCVTMFGRYPPFRKSIYWGEGKKVLGYLCVNSPDCIFHIFKYTGSIIILVWLTIINLNLMQYVAVKISLKKYSVYQYVNNSMMYPYTNTHKLHRGKYIHVDKKKKTWWKHGVKLTQNLFFYCSQFKKTNKYWQPAASTQGLFCYYFNTRTKQKQLQLLMQHWEQKL